MLTPYFVIEALMFILALTINNRSDKSNYKWFAFICLLWALIFGLRSYGVGNDTRNYVFFFLDRSSYSIYGGISENYNIEPGFTYISRFIKLFSNSPTVWFTILSGWLFVMIYKFYKKYCQKGNIFLSLLIVFVISNSFVTLMVATRQSTGFSVLLTGLYLMMNEYDDSKTIRYNLRHNRKALLGLIILVASILVHKSILILLIIMLIAYCLRLSKMTMYIMIGLSMIASILWIDEIGNVFNLFFKTVGAFADSESIRAEIMDIYADNFGSNIQNIVTLFAWAIPVCLSIYLADKEQIDSFFFKLLVFSVCIFLLFNTTFLIERINTLLVLLGCICYLPRKAFAKTKWKYVYFIFVFIILVKAMLRYNNWPINDSCIPYYFFWEK